MLRSSVDLPQPLGPTRPTNSPGSQRGRDLLAGQQRVEWPPLHQKDHQPHRQRCREHRQDVPARPGEAAQQPEQHLLSDLAALRPLQHEAERRLEQVGDSHAGQQQPGRRSQQGTAHPEVPDDPVLDEGKRRCDRARRDVMGDDPPGLRRPARPPCRSRWRRLVGKRSTGIATGRHWVYNGMPRGDSDGVGGGPQYPVAARQRRQMVTEVGK